MRTTLRVFFGLLIFLTILLGIALGIGLSDIQNVGSIESFNANQAALPTRILDINGRLITQFFADEKRELLNLEEMPETLIHAILTREDKEFFEHNGFSISGITRAAIGVLTGNFVGGGSTITQQVAGRLLSLRNEFSIRRKLVELWYAFQLERRWTKFEILEEYLNGSYFGHNTYGVEAASQFLFGHSARELTYAESAILVIQLAAPGGRYSPILNPNSARIIQRTVLDQIVDNGFAPREVVDQSFEEYWASYDFSRSNTTTAYFEREDQAPYFSEFVRQQLQNEILLGSANIFRDGFTVHTTLDLNYQTVATREMSLGLSEASRIFNNNIRTQSEYAAATFSPTVDLLSLAFNMPQLRVAGQKQQQQAKSYFQTTLNPALSLLLYQFTNDAQDPLVETSQISLLSTVTETGTSVVEGALISLENETGYIKAMVGGSRFDPNTNSFNRATQASVQPGSTFKPLYYSGAIDEGIITPATMIYDSPVVFWTDDGKPYAPQNYRGEWSGPVLVRNALARSMNVPSVRVMSMLGFDKAISYTSRLLGIDQRDLVQRGFTRNYTLALGVVSVAPIQMAQAYATIANQGIAVTPLAVRYVEDRFGRVVAEPERQLREQQARAGTSRILSPEAAYIVTSMLESTVGDGTLRYPTSLVGGFDHPIAGKTGTTQNWADLWTLGFSPYFTTAVWIGFDRGGQSMGVNQTGAITAGPIWAKYMKAVHEGLPDREFTRPPRGLVDVEVTATTGLLPPPGFSGRVITEIFKEGTQPRTYDTSETYMAEQQEILVSRLDTKLLEGTGALSIFTDPVSVGNSSIGNPAGQMMDVSLELDDDIRAILASVGVTTQPSSTGPFTVEPTIEADDPTLYDGNIWLDDEPGDFELSNPYLD
ncbi:MAG: PBP1A family penicillin-binding protein [Spirochaetales bacterium]|nr:PBP1A family penicillin-binding protein [Spirochaetales bacterium]